MTWNRIKKVWGYRNQVIIEHARPVGWFGHCFDGKRDVYRELRSSIFKAACCLIMKGRIEGMEEKRAAFIQVKSFNFLTLKGER